MDWGHLQSSPDPQASPGPRQAQMLHSQSVSCLWSGLAGFCLTLGRTREEAQSRGCIPHPGSYISNLCHTLGPGPIRPSAGLGHFEVTLQHLLLSSWGGLLAQDTGGKLAGKKTYIQLPYTGVVPEPTGRSDGDH